MLEGDPVTIGGTVTGLLGSGLVLQNNGGDDLPIAADGEFTFTTSLQPGLTYNVTVLTDPADPLQLCSVENGRGDVPTVNVTDVAVTFVEPGAGIKKVAAEGDKLPDGTTLKSILLDGGVAINYLGKVAFGGKDGNDNKAAFTQAGKEVTEGDTLPGTTTLAKFRGQGELAISAVRSGESVAFHGQAETGKNDTTAMFTQAGKITAVGDTLSDDNTTVDDITESGGVAISDMGNVAYHGRVTNPSSGGDTIRAVLTSEQAAVAREASKLLDGSTLDDINEDGGVAVNLFGKVAFHGTVIVPEAGNDGVKAVCTQDGVVVKEGDTLPDGSTVDEISVNSGVGINLFEDVVFHGRTGGVKAVFSQHGVVAKVGDNLDDGSTLQDIWEDVGVSINPYGFDVAFHGAIPKPGDPLLDIDAVFVGQVPEEAVDTQLP